MRDAWIYTDHDEIAGEAARLLAELGYSPHRVPQGHGLRPSGPNGIGQRPPAVALVVNDREDVCSRLQEDEDLGDVPVLLAVAPESLEDPSGMHEAHELIVLPLVRLELQARIARARRRVHGVETGEIVRVASLEINMATYQVKIDGAPVDFTYMEYELLKFLVTHPGRVFTREALLSRVWGYDYYGGARTVDVHVRRVRAKLGQEHAARIKTVRSVGYRFEA
jgi:two-component system, OmpR family, alkaline phosphatase synthesis response regulator PhoP